ncbi:MAG: OmpA family protein [Flavobacteriales bacterium]|nr:OmpA family protein [Flavobacteriales bacterium]
MKQFLLLVFLSFPIFARASADIVKQSIKFEVNRFSLTEQNQQDLRTIFPKDREFSVEKIDIDIHCEHFLQGEVSRDIAMKRAENVRAFLLSIYDAEGVYEIRMYGEGLIEKTQDDISDRIQITAYILNPSAEDGLNVSELFPEEGSAVGASKDDLTKVDKAPKRTYIPEDLSKDTQFKMEKIYFYGNSARYKRTSEKSLEELLNILLFYDSMKIRLEGHVNGRMGRWYLKRAAKTNPEKTVYRNAQHLSLARAEEIKKYLVENGIDSERVECVGKGGSERIYEKPKSSSENEANRRIEVVILNK